MQWPFPAAIAEKWGQFYTLWNQILYRLHLVLKVVKEDWNFACSILMWSSIRIKNTIWDRRSTTSIMTSINLEKWENTNWFTPTHSFQHDQTIVSYLTTNKNMCQHKHTYLIYGLTSSPLCSRICQDLLRLCIISGFVYEDPILYKHVITPYQ